MGDGDGGVIGPSRGLAIFRRRRMLIMGVEPKQSRGLTISTTCSLTISSMMVVVSIAGSPVSPDTNIICLIMSVMRVFHC